MAYTNPIGSVNGNTFGNQSWSVGKGQRVWREIRHRYPSGGVISNVADFAITGETDKAIIPAGTPVTFDAAAKTIVALKGTKLTNAEKIDGLTQEDIVVEKVGSAWAVATATVIYDGEVYEYMYAAADVTKIKSLAPKGIVFVQ